MRTKVFTFLVNTDLKTTTLQTKLMTMLYCPPVSWIQLKIQFSEKQQTFISAAVLSQMAVCYRGCGKHHQR